MNITRTFCVTVSAILAPVAAFAQSVWGVTDSSQIIKFDLSNPGTVLHTSNISGLRMSDGVTADPFGNLFELAFNKADGNYYALDGNANFYRVNPNSGEASFIASAFAPIGFDGGMAYDPFTGAMRFVSDAGENVEIDLSGNVITGANPTYGVGDVNSGAMPSFVGLGIDHDFGIGYTLDANLDSLAITYDPLFSEFFTVGALGLDFTGLASLEVLFDGSLIAALSEDAVGSSLYTIDLTTGAATKLGDFGVGIRSIAVGLATPVPEPSTYGLIGAAALVGFVVIHRRRSRS